MRWAFFGGALLAGFMVAMIVAALALMHLRVGGPVSQRQTQAYDLVADILPPPLYLVEAMLVVRQGAEDASGAEATLAKLKSLRADYDTRRAYWLTASITAKAKTMLDQSDREVTSFWTLIDQAYAPAVRSGDVIAINTTIAKLEARYNNHRKIIDGLTVEARAMVDAAAAEARSSVMLVISLLTAVAVAMVALVIVGVASLKARIVTPLSRIAAYMSRLAAGDYSEEPPMLGRRDEVGEMAAAISVFRAAAIERRSALAGERAREQATWERAREEAEQSARGRRSEMIQSLDEGLRRLAAGDLKQRIDQAFPEEFEGLRDNFNVSVATLRDTIGQVVNCASAVGAGSKEITIAADDLARRTELQAATLEETSAALHDVTSTVRQTAENAREARQEVTRGRELVSKSSEVAEQAVTAMEDIDTSSRKIGQIITVIDEIAFQTNLLALNAGVEAARAGEAGRGFAVVAQEVRALAQRSADAAKEIKTLVSEASRSVENGVGLVGRVGEELTDVVEQFGKIQDLAEKIAEAARNQATSLGEVNTAVGQMDQATQQNAAMVEQTTAASHSLTQEASQLAQLVARFDLKDCERALAA
ncbi:methyl-accepting chemotaxis protein [Caulobacter sp. FWC2]|uniref:methyl-accepting chemotaxis protein n=1 Tax=Caulobacter sp. FWC2 TaxID=69664 RepID=UPI000C14D358|nr:methyl-accepting chemotaxis protein [Caulobacter sp. FWC2]PIB90421.1 methyl-accepting chemotaxis protein [Caulobacter sp. FWC2]